MICLAKDETHKCPECNDELHWNDSEGFSFCANCNYEEQSLTPLRNVVNKEVKK